jgi:hypothetical protein
MAVRRRSRAVPQLARLDDRGIFGYRCVNVIGRRPDDWNDAEPDCPIAKSRGMGGLHIVRRRLEGISDAAGVALANLDIQVITAPTVRLDLDADRRNLAETVARLQPRLLILDPFVRLHRIDENASGEVAPLLAYLRDLQRRHARSP